MADNFPQIKHVVVLMLENRSFDHLLGGLPGIDGASPLWTNSDGQREYAQSPLEEWDDAVDELDQTIALSLSDPSKEFHYYIDVPTGGSQGTIINVMTDPGFPIGILDVRDGEPFPLNADVSLETFPVPHTDESVAVSLIAPGTIAARSSRERPR